MKKFLQISILVFAGLGLFLSLFSLDLRREAKAPKEAGHLERAIPTTVGKFTSKDIPLGETEEVARSAEKTLAVNEFLNRSYTDGKGVEFTLYMSYWAEGKESTARASAHTPDRCWVSIGWKNIDERRQAAEILNINGKDFLPAYYREMTYDLTGIANKRNIWFWFITNGERYDYGTTDNMMPSLPKYLKNVVNDAFIISPECYFVRIDSSNDLRLLLQDEDFQNFLDSLGDLILYEKENDL